MSNFMSSFCMYKSKEFTSPIAVETQLYYTLTLKTFSSNLFFKYFLLYQLTQPNLHLCTHLLFNKFVWTLQVWGFINWKALWKDCGHSDTRICTQQSTLSTSQFRRNSEESDDYETYKTKKQRGTMEHVYWLSIEAILNEK